MSFPFRHQANQWSGILIEQAINNYAPRDAPAHFPSVTNDKE
jgi:hypothetical protein